MKDQFSIWFNYDHYANQKVLYVIKENEDKVPDDVMKLFSHIMAAHEVWNSRMQQRPNQVAVWERIPLEAMEDRLVRNIENTQLILEEYSLETEFFYKTTQGDPFTNSIQDTFFHLLTHSMYHRGQIARSLREQGITPPETNYITFRR